MHTCLMRKYWSLLELRLRLCNGKTDWAILHFICIATQFEEYEEKYMGQHLSESEPQNCIFHEDYVQDSTVSHGVNLFMSHCYLLRWTLQMHNLLPFLLLSKETRKGLAEGT